MFSNEDYVSCYYTCVCLFSANNVMESQISPLKLGMRAHPPALTLVYRSAAGKERYRVMPVRFLNKFGSVDNVLKEMKDKHTDYLNKVSS